MSSSRVDQLVQKRTAVRSPSGRHQKQLLYFRFRISRAWLGITGNCWLVGVGRSRVGGRFQRGVTSVNIKKKFSNNPTYNLKEQEKRNEQTKRQIREEIEIRKQ